MRGGIAGAYDQEQKEKFLFLYLKYTTAWLCCPRLDLSRSCHHSSSTEATIVSPAPSLRRAKHPRRTRHLQCRQLVVCSTSARCRLDHWSFPSPASSVETSMKPSFRQWVAQIVYFFGILVRTKSSCLFRRPNSRSAIDWKDRPVHVVACWQKPAERRQSAQWWVGANKKRAR